MNHTGQQFRRRLPDLFHRHLGPRATSSIPARPWSSVSFVPESFKESVKSSLISHVTSRDPNWLHDPLDDLALKGQQLRFWPDLPKGVQSQDPSALANIELSLLVKSIRTDLLGTHNAVLNQAATYFFESDGGKKIRPMIVLLLARALSDSIQPRASKDLFCEPFSWQRPDLIGVQRNLAQVAELFHTASLLHDDVLDDADTRRNLPAVHTVFGNKMAILAGDFILARASATLARMRNNDVVECMSTVLEHLVLGEVMQMKSDGRLVHYLRKNFYKTASLMALSCKSTAILGDYEDDLVDACYRFGKHVGMAFQLVDDTLDLEGTESQLGKPALADLRSGIATAPVLFAAEEFPELEDLIDRKFRADGDVDLAQELVFQSDGMTRTKLLARLHAEQAMSAVLELAPSAARDALVYLAYQVVLRTR